MPPKRLLVEKITFQKDTFSEQKHGDFAGKDFADSLAKEADLVHMKRFCIKCAVEDAEGRSSFLLVVDLRGHIVTINAKDCRYAASQLRTHITPIVDAFLRPGMGEPLAPAGVGEGEDKLVCITPDGWWLANVLHVIHENKGTEFRSDLPARPAVPADIGRTR